MNRKSVGPEEEEREQHVGELIDRTIAGDTGAWHELLVDEVEPVVAVVTGRWKVVGRLCRSEEDRRNIADDVIERLHADGFRRLRELRVPGEERRAPFGPWIARVAANTAIDYLRACPEYDATRRRWARIGQLHEGLPGVHADPSGAFDAGTILDCASRILRPRQIVALYLWLTGSSKEDIAGRLGITPAAVVRLVRSALKRLRDRFAPEEKTTEAGDEVPRDSVKDWMKPPAPEASGPGARAAVTTTRERRRRP
jgi:DNA-directed RNA polymerase specialized sigma24 family protein